MTVLESGVWGASVCVFEGVRVCVEMQKEAWCHLILKPITNFESSSCEGVRTV